METQATSPVLPHSEPAETALLKTADKVGLPAPRQKERLLRLGAWVVLALTMACGERRSDVSEERSEDTAEIELASPTDTIEPPTPAPAGPKNILFVVDASGSMRSRIEEQPKLEIAKDVLSEWIEELSDADVRAGLIAYGHRQENDCADIEQLVQVKPLDKAELIAQVRSLSPKGQTPIASSLEQAAEALSTQEGQATIVLISDGKETCNRDPCEAVRRLRAERDFVLHVVGFDIVSEEDALQLRCLAEAGGGIYTTAATIEGLSDAFRLAAEADVLDRDTKVQENIEIILDRSLQMTQTFENRTRLDAAAKALTDILRLQVADRDNLAYREFGGACQGDSANTELRVEFQQNNATRIRDSLSVVSPRGEATLVDAVTKAAYDFEDRERFDGVNKRVLIITGSIGTCFRRQAAETIRQRLANRDIRPEFTFIGIDIPLDDRQEFIEIAQATGGQALLVDSMPDLARSLEIFFEDLPVFNDIDILVDTLNAVTDRLTQSMEYLGQENYAAAEGELDQARPLSRSPSVTRSFRDLARRHSKDEYRRLFEIAREIRELQRELIIHTERLIVYTKEGDRDGLIRSAEEGERIGGRFDQLVDEGNAILEILRQE